MKVRYSPAALKDLENIHAYISDTLLNPEAAQRLIAAILAACTKLDKQPFLGIELNKKLKYASQERYLIVKKYLIVYEVTDAVDILRVLDTRTNYISILLKDLMEP